MRRILRRTRVRLTLLYTAIVLVVAGVGAGVYWIVFSRVEMGGVDSTLLRAQGRLLAAGITSRGGGDFAFANTADLSTTSGDGASVTAALLGDDGRVLDSSAPAPPGVLDAANDAPRNGSALISTVSAPSQVDERVLVRRVQLPGDGTGTLVLARTLGDYQDTLRNTAIFLAVAAGVITVLAGGSGYWLSGRVLRPVREISGLARGLSEHTLDQRITLDLPDDEIGDLAATFNAMLARLESAFTTLQRFTADAAHELRAPLAVVTTQVEVALQRARSAEAYQTTLGTVLAETQRLSGLADQLLTLARADAGALRPHLQSVDIADLLEDLVDRWQPVAHDRGVELVTNLPASGDAAVDVDMIRRLLDNLLDNALRHTPRGGEVSICAAVDNGMWTLGVEDTGPGIPEEMRARLFERFTRTDPSRTRESGGAGLGLSICTVIARLHGGEIRLDDRHASRFVARLPRTPVNPV